jgi:hypothetical protein
VRLEEGRTKGVVFFSDKKKKERKGIRRNKCVNKTLGENDKWKCATKDAYL